VVKIQQIQQLEQLRLAEFRVLPAKNTIALTSFSRSREISMRSR